MPSGVVLGNGKALVALVPISIPWGRCGEMEGDSVGQFICVMSVVNCKALLFAVQRPSPFCKVSGNNTTQVPVSALSLLQILDLPVVVLDVLSVLGLADIEWAVSATIVSLRSFLYLIIMDLMKGRGTQPWDKSITSPKEYLALNSHGAFEFTV